MARWTHPGPVSPGAEIHAQLPISTQTSAEGNSALVTRFATADNPWYALIILPVHLDQGTRKITDCIREKVLPKCLNMISTEECHGLLVN
jgi:hypothetical protein